MSAEREVAALLITSDYRGDHAADVSVAVKVTPEDTVADLIQRAGLATEQDHLEIRLVKS